MNNTIKLDLTKEEVKYLYDVLENNHALVDVEQDNIMSSTIFQKLQGKLISRFVLSSEDIREIRQNRYCEENQFDERQLFMGGGWHSVNKAHMMHKRLAYATMMLGGREQNGGMGTEFNEEYDKRSEIEIKKALRDVIAAFGYSVDELKMERCNEQTK